jgi:hypothetical protein
LQLAEFVSRHRVSRREHQINRRSTIDEPLRGYGTVAAVVPVSDEDCDALARADQAKHLLGHGVTRVSLERCLSQTHGKRSRL